MKSKILLIYTGGTIGMVKDYESGSLKPLDFNNIYKRLPEINQLDCEITALSFENPIDSSNIKPDDWIYLAELIEENYEKFDAFVVLHGTDTMSFTASALSFMLEGLQKPVILTGSQLPIGDLRTDAKENMITSIYIATLKQGHEALVKEVGVYFEYKLYRGNRTTKFSAEQFDAFRSSNYPFLIESGVNLHINHSLLYQAPEKNLKVYKMFSEDVALLKIFPGITQQVVEAVLNIPNIKGIILETFGAGNAPTEKWFLDLIEKAIEKGIIIVNVTQCLAGGVVQGKYEASSGLKNRGVISSEDMTTESALTKMMLGLCITESQIHFKQYFTSNIRGEISKMN
ncbi:asparaginase [Flavobacteriaceae bacterium UJ101]|nr:asparaginase [Flavobacteriaceae bacterium UJ101]